jgi:hypothetical protein
MKNFLCLFFFLYFFIFPSISNALENGKKEKFPIIDNQNGASYHLYYFQRLNTCVSSYDNLFFHLEKIISIENKQLDIIVFCAGAGSTLIDSLNTKYKGKALFVNDMLAAYSKTYKIDKSNALILLDQDSTLVCQYELADIKKTALDIDSLKKKLGNLSLNFEDIKLNKNDAPLICVNGAIALYSNKLKTFYILDSKNKKLFFTDSLGKIFKEKDIKTINDDVCEFFDAVNWEKENSTMLISALIRDVKNRTFISMNYRYVIAEDKFETLDKLLQPENSNLLLSYSQNLDKYIRINLTEKDGAYYPFELVDLKDKSRKPFGSFDSLYMQNNLYPLYKGYINCDSDGIYTYYLFSSNICKYNAKGELMKSINLEKPPFQRSNNVGITNNTDKYGWAKFSNNSTMEYDFFFDAMKKKFYIIKMNTTFPEGVNDPDSPLVQKVFYLCEYDLNGKLIKYFPLNMTYQSIAGVENDCIYISHVTNNQIQIRKYKI